MGGSTMEKNIGIGIIEGFFGPHWSWDSRDFICDFLAKNDSQFYVYAPKQDSFLRKNWMQDHPPDLWHKIQSLSQRCSAKKIAFGLGLSPFEIHDHWTAETKNSLREKILKLEDLDSKYLGLFFDDMKGSPDLADKQIEIVEFVRNITRQTILFCPTYYSDDPILDKVFGTRAPDYLEKIGKNISNEVMILWTGKKVISPIIQSEDLEPIAEILKRKPVIWDNFFANDGPKQCKFLKLKPLTGRTQQSLQSAGGWAFNLMNQAHLSAVVYLASVQVLKMNVDPVTALNLALKQFSDEEFKDLIIDNKQDFLETGLDQAAEQLKISLNSFQYKRNQFPIVREVFDWIEGQYNVGSECLTD